jgi:hypothetical protein
MLINDIITENRLVQEITRPDRQDSASKLLQSKGYKTLGSGYYATVLGKPETPHVLKLLDSTDKGYLEYVALAMAVENPHFPKFRGKPFRVTREYYAVRLERLTPINDNVCKKYGFKYNYQLLRILGSITESAKRGNQGNLSDNDFLEMEFLFDDDTGYSDSENHVSPNELARLKYENFKETHPELVNACILIGKHVDSSRSIDIHGGNVMMRGDTLVITDPVCFGNY